MTGHTIRTRCLSAGAALAVLALTGCDGSDAEAGGAVGATLRHFTVEPAFLFPGMVNDEGGLAVLNALFSPLVGYDEDGRPYPVAASALPSSTDGVTWTIEVAGGRTFHNGEPVTARSFVDAWNWSAYGPNAARLNYLFGPGNADISGYADVQGGPDPDADGPQQAPRPGVSSMAGLQVVDELTFTVTLAHPHSQFPLLLGQPAFYPLPSDCLADWEACNEAPIGNGPFEMDGAWEHDEQIRVVAYDDYEGMAPSIGGVDFQLSATPRAAYADLEEGRLDYLTGIPDDLLDTARAQLGDRIIDKPAHHLSSLILPMWDDRFGFGGAATDYGGEGGRNLRHALSMAIDRQGMADTLLDGARTAAESLVPPVVTGGGEVECRQWCTYDTAAARALYEASPGFDGPVTIWTTDVPIEREVVDAVAGSWRDTFGIEVEVKPVPWAERLRALSDRTLSGPYDLGWAMDFPSIQNYVAPLYGEDAGSSFGYVNEQANALMAAADSASTVEAGVDLYVRAADLVLQDMPVIPLFFGRTVGGFSERVHNVSLDPYDRLDLVAVTVEP